MNNHFEAVVLEDKNLQDGCKESSIKAEDTHAALAEANFLLAVGFVNHATPELTEADNGSGIQVLAPYHSGVCKDSRTKRMCDPETLLQLQPDCQMVNLVRVINSSHSLDLGFMS